MAKTIALIHGGTPKEVEATTVGEARTAIGAPASYTATQGGEPAADSDLIEDGLIVKFTPAQVKGA